MSSPERIPELELVDLVLYDAAFGGGIDGRVGVHRLPATNSPLTVVIASPAAKDYVLSLPDLDAPETVERFVDALQQYLITVYREPVPVCPLNDHQHHLTCQASRDTTTWSCPDGQWSCPIGQYNRCSWPPKKFEDLQTSAMNLLIDAEIEELRSGHCECRGGDWTVVLGVWPMSEALTERLRGIIAPISLELQPEPGTWWAA
jgi:hypothetical protein